MHRFRTPIQEASWHAKARWLASLRSRRDQARSKRAIDKLTKASRDLISDGEMSKPNCATYASVANATLNVGESFPVYG